MAVWCPQCSKKTHNEYVCDFCTFPIKKQSPQAVSSQNYFPLNIKKYLPVYIMMGMITLSLIYIAYDKFQQREQEKQALRYFTGYDSLDDYMKSDKTKMNSKFIKDTNEQLRAMSKSQIDIFSNLDK